MGKCTSKRLADITNTQSFGDTPEGPLAPSKTKVEKKTDLFKDKKCWNFVTATVRETESKLPQMEIPFFGIAGTFNKEWQKVGISPLHEYWYVGEWKNGQRHGKGSLYNCHEQFLISGLFVNSRIQTSNCRKIYSDGSYYVGSINQKFEAQGSGCLYSTGGKVHEGNFTADKPDGGAKQIEKSKSTENLHIFSSSLLRKDRSGIYCPGNFTGKKFCALR